VSDQTSIGEALDFATEVLSEAGIPEPVRDARALVCLAAEVDKAFTYAHPEHRLSAEETARVSDLVRRRAGHEPVQYISGQQEFYGREFKVTRDVMIPRPETELIVEEGISLISGIEKPLICEVGVGSGCIVVSLLCEVPGSEAVALDISPAAIAIASANAEALGAYDRIELRESDVFSGLRDDETFDLIVSNPPYVPAEDVRTLQAEVREFEPETALTDGGSGLSIIEKIVSEAGAHLRPGGYLLMEIGFNQSQKVREIFSRHTNAEVEFFPDLQGIPRMVKARYSGI